MFETVKDYRRKLWCWFFNIHLNITTQLQFTVVEKHLVRHWSLYGTIDLCCASGTLKIDSKLIRESSSPDITQNRLFISPLQQGPNGVEWKTAAYVANMLPGESETRCVDEGATCRDDRTFTKGHSGLVPEQAVRFSTSVQNWIKIFFFQLQRQEKTNYDQAAGGATT